MEKKSAFSQEIITECEIQAPAAKVHSVISDFRSFHKWTNDIVISGDARPGVSFSVTVNDPSSGPMKLKSRILSTDRRKIVFRHVYVARFMLSCIHRYEIIPLSADKTKFINAEIFSGLAVPFVRKKKLLVNARKFKDGFNAAFKKAVEAKAR